MTTTTTDHDVPGAAVAVTLPSAPTNAEQIAQEAYEAAHRQWPESLGRETAITAYHLAASGVPETPEALLGAVAGISLLAERLPEGVVTSHLAALGALLLELPAH